MFLLRLIAILLYALIFPRGTQRFWDIAFNHKREKYVVVYPHSSRWDSFYFLIFSLAYNVQVPAVCYYKYFEYPVLGTLLRAVGLIPVGQAKNTTQQIIDHLNQKSSFVFWIAPQGGITKAEWKKGYYYIARATGAKIVIVGLDYYYHTMVAGTESIDPLTLEYEAVEKTLKTEFQHINALYPNDTEPRSESIPNRFTTCVDLLMIMTKVVCVLLLVKGYWMYALLQFFLGGAIQTNLRRYFEFHRNLELCNTSLEIWESYTETDKVLLPLFIRYVPFDYTTFYLCALSLQSVIFAVLWLN